MQDDDFQARKKFRREHYLTYVYGWKLRPCIACNGSGYYDNFGSPACSACQEETDVGKLRALCLRWNKMAAKAGACGSEYIDDPERVFEHIERCKRTVEQFAHRKGVLGLPLKGYDDHI